MTLKALSVSGSFGRKGLRAVRFNCWRDQDQTGKILETYFCPNIYI